MNSYDGRQHISLSGIRTCDHPHAIFELYHYATDTNNPYQVSEFIDPGELVEADDKDPQAGQMVEELDLVEPVTMEIEGLDIVQVRSATQMEKLGL